MFTERLTHVPALSLPFELISAIFVLCLPRRRRVRPHPLHAPLNLASVCSHWRAVALGTPELWASISWELNDDIYYGIPQLFDSDGALLDFDHPLVALMNSWFPRASGYPLSISVFHSGNGSVSNSIWTAMSSYCFDLGRIELTLPVTEFEAFDRAFSSIPFPSLTTLSIRVPDIETDDVPPIADDVQFNSIAHSSSLEVLDFRAYNIGLDTHRLNLLPHTLRAIHLLCWIPYTDENMPPLTADPLALILVHFPTLEVLHILISLFALAGYPNPQRVTSTSLKMLIVNNEDALNHLTLPNLLHLHIPYIRTPSVLHSFFSHSQCRRLSTLAIGISGDLDNDALIGILSLLPELESLSLEVMDPDPLPATFNWETILFRVDLVPRLRTLAIQLPSYHAPSAYELWIELIQARKATLRRAHLFMENDDDDIDMPSPSPPYPEIKAKLGALVMSGIDARIITNPRETFFEFDFGLLGPIDLQHARLPQLHFGENVEELVEYNERVVNWWRRRVVDGEYLE
ncbi:hypothetical protein R3P38DRAFT_2818295 [Favolaschia claudopus]|uniref:F-box domain-containing protein n=1 Tax=Favolaschia claudopus TaxID=2862362 RepID=A0AAW0ECF7_9AGAR